MNFKTLKIRVFDLDSVNKNLTESEFDLLKVIESALSQKTKSQERRMILNQQDPDEDVLANFDWGPNKSYLFGTMMRIAPTDTTGTFSNDFFEKEKFNIKDLHAVANSQNTSICKLYYYFIMDNKHLLTTLPGNKSISGFQTYINWLTDSFRGTNLISFLPTIVIPQNIKIDELKQIEIGENSKIVTSLNQGFGYKVKELSSNLMRELFSCDNKILDEIDLEQLVSARLVLKINKKPKEITEESFKKILGTLIKPITNDSGINLLGKNNTKLAGSEIKLVKDIEIETTAAGNYNEEQLKQNMESILYSLDSNK